MKKASWQGCETSTGGQRLEVNRKYSVSRYGVLFTLRGAEELFFGSITFPVVPHPLTSEGKAVPAHWVPSHPFGLRVPGLLLEIHRAYYTGLGPLDAGRA